MLKRNLVLLCFLAISAQAQPRADLGEGTLAILGNLTGNYEVTGLGSDKITHEINLTSAFGFGFFAVDNLMFGGAIPIAWPIYNSSNAQKFGSIGLNLFSTYFIDLDSVMYPYFGLNVTPGYNIGAKSFRLSAGIDAGILISMSEAVALDFGIRPEVSFKIHETDQWMIKIPTGFVGVRAFF